MDIRNIYRRIDIPSIVTVLLLCIYGVVAVYSATSTNTQNSADPFFILKKELLSLVIGIIAMVAISLVSYNNLKSYSIPFYVFNIVLLLVVLMIGSSHKGAQSWIEIGSFQLQPSEFSKLFIIISFAGFISTRKGQLDTVKDLALSLGFVGLPLVLVLLQPDLGTAMCYVAVMLGMMLVAGVPARHFAIIALAGVIIALAALQFHVLQDYQISRLTVFVNPDNDPQGAGYNLLQSKIAIGSGQLMGKGLFSGTQTRLQFLPERHTDFIFSVIAEEFGFIGAAFLLILFFVLVMQSIRTAMFSKNMFGVLIAAGIISLWLFQILVNIGMTIGLMPITGIPLPFISYGNSSLIVHLLAVGLLLNVHARSYV